VVLNVIVFIQPNHGSLSGSQLAIGVFIAELVGFALSTADYQLLSRIATPVMTAVVGYILIATEAVISFAVVPLAPKGPAGFLVLIAMFGSVVATVLWGPYRWWDSAQSSASPR
jgi:hypothetical protein